MGSSEKGRGSVALYNSDSVSNILTIPSLQPQAMRPVLTLMEDAPDTLPVHQTRGKNERTLMSSPSRRPTSRARVEDRTCGMCERGSGARVDDEVFDCGVHVTCRENRRGRENSCIRC
jgi:hypothetical protein